MAEKKKFHLVEIPILKREIELISTEQEKLKGKYAKIDLTSDLKGKSIELKLKVDLKDSKLIAEPTQLQLFGSYIRRMINKGTNYVENSYFLESKDNLLKVKQFMITRRKVPRKVRNALKQASEKEFKEYAKTKTFEGIITDILNNKIQKEISVKMKKIYPLSMCEIKYLGIATEKEAKEKNSNSEIKDK